MAQAVASRLLRLGFPSAALAASFFPMVLMKHVSEIYLTAVILGLALLIGLSAHGWTTVTRPLRYVALFLASLQIFVAADAIQDKVAGINESGERADAMMLDLLEHLPNDGSTKKVAMAFLKRDAAGSRGYSHCRMISSSCGDTARSRSVGIGATWMSVSTRWSSRTLPTSISGHTTSCSSGKPRPGSSSRWRLRRADSRSGGPRHVSAGLDACLAPGLASRAGRSFLWAGKPPSSEPARDSSLTVRPAIR